ncbi:MAG TPA: GNAT family N-acetyltransferase [Candidatus Limnocylindrales bacterium]|nr:GNAT family N-acetyltransferase [Candidatus Limnocylindrales bacterium]
MSAPSVAGARLRPIAFPAEVETVVDLLLEINQHDQPGWFPTVPGLTNDWAPTSSFFPDRDLQGLEVDGRLVGLARHSWRDRPAVVNHRVELWVHPDHRRVGHGTRLLEWAEARARESATEPHGLDPTKPHQIGGNGPDNVPAVDGFAVAHGFAPYRFHFEMRRSLTDPIPDVPLPDGLAIRPAAPEHLRAVYDADEEAFQDHWDHAEPVEGDYERFVGDPDLDPSLWQVAWDGDQVAGLIINTIYQRENELEGVLLGWLDSVATRRPWRARGLAGALIVRSMAALRDRGMTEAGLGVDAENPSGALRLYEKFGFRRIRTWTFYRMPL